MNHVTPHDPSSPVPTFDTDALRHAFGQFATGITITTAMSGNGDPVGFTANSFTSVSLDPPLVLVCLGARAAGFPLFRDAAGFCVNILAADQQDLAPLFAMRGADKFADVPWRSGVTGAPIFQHQPAYFDCKMHQQVPAGDHLILIGQVVDFQSSGTDDPLCFHKGRYARLAPSNPRQDGGSK